MRLKAYGVSISGRQLSLEGEDGSPYGICMTNITCVTFCAAQETLEIVEQFETQVERQTTLSKARGRGAASAEKGDVGRVGFEPTTPVLKGRWFEAREKAAIIDRSVLVPVPDFVTRRLCFCRLFNIPPVSTERDPV